jgi:ABC-2 type transport system ATP-binding protein
VVPPARPYPLTAPFRELRVLALLAAAGSAGVFAVVMRGAAGNSGSVRRPGGLSGLSRAAWADVTGTGDGGHRRARWSGGKLAGMDDNGVITVRDLRRRYGGTGGRGFDAVRGVTFSVRRGELFALLGTNGAGKTSTMEVLEGLALPARGAVRVLGCDPYRERALVRRRTGIILQEGGFPPDLTVAETGRMWAGTLSAPRPVAEALALVSLGHRGGSR